jgi:hypothetical protein
VLIAIGSVKGSPYVTSLAVALAARWPRPGALVVEADPAGGDLAFRFGARREPGLSELAADTRAGFGGRDLGAYAQRIPLGIDVLFAPADQQRGDEQLRLPDRRTGPPDPREPGEVIRVLGLAARNCVDLLRSTAVYRPVIIDLGRLGWDSPALPLAAAADVLLLACWSGVEAIDAVQVRRDRILALPGMRASIRLVLVGQPPCPEQEIADAVGLPVVGVVPEDARAAAVLAGRAQAGWGWTRLPLPRAARSIALALNAEFPDRAEPVARHAVPPVIYGVRGPERVRVQRP